MNKIYHNEDKIMYKYTVAYGISLTTNLFSNPKNGMLN